MMMMINLLKVVVVIKITKVLKKIIIWIPNRSPSKINNYNKNNNSNKNSNNNKIQNKNKKSKMRIQIVVIV